MSDEKRPEVGEIWVNRKSKRRVEIRTSAYPAVVWYKALVNPNGGHTAEAKKPIGTFLKEFRPEAQTVDLGNPSSVTAAELRPAPWPQPINTSTLSVLAQVIRARAGKMYNYADRESYQQAQQAMYEIADALDEIADDAALVLDRSTFLSMDVSSLLIRAKLADREAAFRAIAAGDVYLDGQRVTEDAPITTVTRERFTVRCGERSAVVRVVG